METLIFYPKLSFGTRSFLEESSVKNIIVTVTTLPFKTKHFENIVRSKLELRSCLMSFTSFKATFSFIQKQFYFIMMVTPGALPLRRGTYKAIKQVLFLSIISL